jgi:hypothetical protein
LRPEGLYQPTSWTGDHECWRQASLNDTVAFETKMAMAKRWSAAR